MPRRSTEPELATTWRHVLTLRLQRQHLMARASRPRLVDVVGRLVGLHAQVMSSAELQAAARIDGLRRQDVADALWQRRTLVKTWAFRQTLHLLTVEDLVRFVRAARSLERWHNPAWLRYFEISEARFEEVIGAIGDVLSSRPMTRVEVVDAVVERLDRPQLRERMLTGWGTFLGPAAQRGRLVFGPSEGRNVAFVDPSAWLRRRIDADLDDARVADEALGALIVRYLGAFPGASRDMIARWWGGGRVAAVTRAIAALPEPLAEVDVEGMRGFVLRSDLAALAAAETVDHVRLVPGFDPFTNELPRRVESVLGEAVHEQVHRTAGWVTPVVVVDGRIGGTWQLRTGKRSVVEVVRWPTWKRAARAELGAEVDRIAAFLDTPLAVEISRAAGR